MARPKKITLEAYLAIIATVVALLALFVSVWQGYISREHNKKSVRPLLTIVAAATGLGGEDDVGIYINNCGFGPAIVDDYALYLDGDPKPYRNINMWAHFAERVPEIKGFKYSWLTPGMPLPADQSILAVGVDSSSFKNAEEIRVFMRNFKGVDVRIRYHSIYGEKFEVSFRDSFTNPDP